MKSASTASSRSWLCLSALAPILASCSSSGSPAPVAQRGSLAGRAIVEGAAGAAFAGPRERVGDDDLYRAADRGDLGDAGARWDGLVGSAQNRIDCSRLVATKAGGVRVALHGDVRVVVQKLTLGGEPQLVAALGAVDSEIVVSVAAGDHLLFVVSASASAPYSVSADYSQASAPQLALPAAVRAAADQAIDAALPEAMPGDIVVLARDQQLDPVALQRLGFELVSQGGGSLRVRPMLGLALRDDRAGKQALASDLFRLRRALPGIVAEPNYVYRGLQTRVPNDTHYALQWAMPLCQMPQAWGITTGDPVVIGVVDSGITGHPELRDRTLADGFDMVADVANAGDNDGRDPSPGDPLRTDNQSGFHGSHVAGIAAARSNDQMGVAGVSWGARILAVRVLGITGSGTADDIAQGILYAAGLENASGRVPASPARIINMSLGSSVSSAVIHDACQRARAAGAILVAAAGNEAQRGNPISYPAAHPEVIAVGAVGPTGNRAPYSQMHPYVAIAAPGGDQSSQRQADGILSTVPYEQGGSWYASWHWLEGTSMAAPFVAGAIALMLSVRAELTHDQVLAILAATARDRGAPGRDNEYGHGLIDVGAAVAAARDYRGVELTVDRTSLTFSGSAAAAQVVRVSAASGQVGGLVLEPPTVNWLRASLSAASTPAELRVSLEPQALPTAAAETTLRVRGEGNTVVDVRVSFTPAGGGGGVQPVLQVMLFDANRVFVAQVEVQNGQFTFGDLALGDYVVMAGADVNSNRQIGDPGDYLSDPMTVTVRAGATADAGTLRARLR